MNKDNYRWEWHFPRHGVSDVWRLVSNMGRITEHLGLPLATIKSKVHEDGCYKFVGELGKIKWLASDLTWLENSFLEQEFSIHGHDIIFVKLRLELQSEESGTQLILKVDVESKVSSRKAAKWLQSYKIKFDELISVWQAELQGNLSPPMIRTVDLSDETLKKIQELKLSRFSHHLGTRLMGWLANARDQEVTDIYPLKLAMEWQVDLREMIELCLQAAALDILELRWNLLCPRCHCSSATANTLDMLPTGEICKPCNIHFGRDFSQNMEVSFTVSPLVRKLPKGKVAPQSPRRMPHIVLHHVVYPGQTLRVNQDWASGDYRVRMLGKKAYLEFEWKDGKFPHVSAEGFNQLKITGNSPENKADITNDSKEPQTFIIEHTEWPDHLLTGANALTFYAFRKFFPDQVLSPGDEVAVSKVAIMFTDLKSSTALYEESGDTRAYHVVRDHFTFLQDEIRRHNGAMVKTIGDAVMAAFSDPLDAVTCALAIQNGVAGFNRNYKKRRITLKVGVHSGSCLAVTLNGRLDYFGNMLNMASRFQDESLGGDVVVSIDTLADAKVSEFLSDYTVKSECTQIKGLNDQVQFGRINISEESSIKQEESEDDEYEEEYNSKTA